MGSVDLRAYESCTLCPRKCGANRAAGELGVCGASSRVSVARAALHLWEEPPISGVTGSGTVFFAHCPLHCVYCQNSEISVRSIDAADNPWIERAVSVEELSDIFFDLQDQGANNINLVTATHYLPEVAGAIERARSGGLAIPFLLNTSGYESIEALRALDGLIDIYLTDFKYADSALAQRYSRAADYPQVAKEALAEMVRQTGAPKYRADGGEGELLVSGTVVRHLALPGCFEDSLAIIEYLGAEYGAQIALSLMSQFMPLADPDGFPEIARRIDPHEYDALVERAETLDFEECFIQDPSAAIEEYIPAFEGL
ncbi:MAG: radical SAM protein [bacterium]|nr:radical SAM protein [bacterium]